MKRFSYLVHYSQRIERIAKLPSAKLFETTGGSPQVLLKAMAESFKKNLFFESTHKGLKAFGSKVFEEVFII